MIADLTDPKQATQTIQPLTKLNSLAQDLFNLTQIKLIFIFIVRWLVIASHSEALTDLKSQLCEYKQEARAVGRGGREREKLK